MQLDDTSQGVEPGSEQSRDPDVWPPPTPQEPKYMYVYIELVPSLVRNLSLPPPPLKAGLIHERI